MAAEVQTLPVPDDPGWTGTLPPVAERRLAELGREGAFTSDLSVAEFEAINSVGFRPVGLVQGSAVYQIGFTGWGWCGAQPYGMGLRLGMPAGLPSVAAPGDAFAPLVHALRELRHAAMERARSEAAVLGGDGVVGVRLTMAPFPGAPNTLEFQAIGTAVRSVGRTRPPRPFLSDLSGQEFAKCLRAGWVPVDLVMGIAVEIRHDDYQTRAAGSVFNTVNQEIPGFTELVQRTRHVAREALAADVARVGGEAAVIARMDLRIHEQECPAFQGGRDHIGEATVIGTALARFDRTARERAGRLAVLPLSRSGTPGKGQR